MAMGSLLPTRTDPPWFHGASTSYARSKVRARPSIVLCLGVCIGSFFTSIFFALLSLPSSQKKPSSSELPVVERLREWTDPVKARKKLSIFVYDLPIEFNSALVERSHRRPPSIRDPFCDSNFYSSELHVHKFLQSSAVRTTDPEKADFFFVPIYATCNLIIHQPNDMARNGAHFARGMDIVINEFPYWNRTNGRDHIFVFAQGFGARLSGEWRRYRNAIFLVHNGEITAPEYTPHKDFTIPPQLRHYLLPIWLDASAAARPVEKTYLAHFGGQIVNSRVKDHRGSNYSHGVRQYIQANFMDNDDYRITGVRTTTYLEDMKKSKFCLAPEGWHPWSPRPYYGILMGCIPVVISESQELAFEDLVDYDSFVVWVRPREIRKLDSILRAFSEEEIARRRQAMSQYWRLFWYGREGLAFQAILDELHRRKHSSHIRRQFV